LTISFSLGFIWISIRLVGGVLVSLICMRQTDFKSLIAYSSVAHMGIVIGGIMTFSMDLHVNDITRISFGWNSITGEKKVCFLYLFDEQTRGQQTSQCGPRANIID
jgi:NADH:ubiquinone oxidoreductase subunit 2 (subunit N)